MRWQSTPIPKGLYIVSRAWWPLGAFRRALAVFVAELREHEPVHRGAWREQSVWYHLEHCRDHCNAALTKPLPEAVEDLRHAQSRAIMANEVLEDVIRATARAD